MKDEEIITYTCDPNRTKEYKIDKIEDYKVYTNNNIDKFKDNIFKLNDRIITFLNDNLYIEFNEINIVNKYTDILNYIMWNIGSIRVDSRKHKMKHRNLDEKIYKI